MCGITGGIWNEPTAAISEPLLEQMTRELVHRGPDQAGTYRSELHRREPFDSCPGVALGFRRLSIIDLEGSRQPLANEDESVWVIFNGEIYNYQDLRHRLEGSGHRFRTTGDTEVIVHLYEDEGLDCFSHLNGMFAIAIWDSRKRRLVLGRDRLGQKPLVYQHTAERTLFASELKSLLVHPDVSREVDPSAIDEYLTYQYVPHPNTIFRQIRKLPPGHLACIENGTLRVEPYWQPELGMERDCSEKWAVEKLRELLRSSVELRMRSDVPLGAFLSGGVDSSLIVALMQQFSNERIKTFSIGFPVAEYNETDYARQVAKFLGTEHHEFEVTPDAVHILPDIVYHFDEPFGDSSAIPTWYVSQHTREHVTVALTGDGGDELFLGYPRYKAVALAAWLDGFPPFRDLLTHRLWQAIPVPARQKSKRRRMRRFCEALAKSPGRRYLDWISIFNEPRRAELYTDDFVESLADADPYEFLRRTLQLGKGRDPVTQVANTDLLTYLPGDLMTKVDIASMAHSLECRQPFLDFRVVEFAISLPRKLNFRRYRGKRLLRAAFGELLPPEIWERSKMGFGVPLDHWFRNELRDLAHDTLLDSSTLGRNMFRREAVESLLHEHVTGTFDHSYRLWNLLVLELWMRRWLDSPLHSNPI